MQWENDELFLLNCHMCQFLSLCGCLTGTGRKAHVVGMSGSPHVVCVCVYIRVHEDYTLALRLTKLILYFCLELKLPPPPLPTPFKKINK